MQLRHERQARPPARCFSPRTPREKREPRESAPKSPVSVEPPFAVRRLAERPHCQGTLKKAAELVMEIDVPEEAARTRAVRELSMICLNELGRPNEIPRRLLRLFEHNAAYSPFEDVRRACIDAIYLCHDLERLESLIFEPGDGEMGRHRDKLAALLRRRGKGAH